LKPEETTIMAMLSLKRRNEMDKVRFVYWQDENMWLGYLEDYPD